MEFRGGRHRDGRKRNQSGTFRVGRHARRMRDSYLTERGWSAGSFRLVDQFGGQALAASIRHLRPPMGAGLLGGGSRGMYEVSMPGVFS